MSKPVYSNAIVLTDPIERGSGDKKQIITEIKIRKPKSGELRGLSLAQVLQMNVDTLAVLLPRITEPPLNEADIATVDPADLTDMAIEVVSFLDKTAGSR